MRHTISLLVKNRFGVLAHIAGMFGARAYNIESLSVGETEDPNISRMTIITSGDERVIEQVLKQLNKQIDVIKVQDLTGEEFVQRELLLIKVNADSSKRSEIVEISDLFRAKIIDVSNRYLIIEVTGDRSKVDAIIKLLTPFGIKELARTGAVGMIRSSKDNE
ncbi:acetolactate synthase small subunit [Candidatus Desantisbacteria bacterium]|nr:acetolactate synthase small subunit [Candidatus Desantisbacteria bacterium]